MALPGLGFSLYFILFFFAFSSLLLSSCMLQEKPATMWAVLWKECEARDWWPWTTSSKDLRFANCSTKELGSGSAWRRPQVWSTQWLLPLWTLSHRGQLSRPWISDHQNWDNKRLLCLATKFGGNFSPNHR